MFGVVCVFVCVFVCFFARRLYVWNCSKLFVVTVMCLLFSLVLFNVFGVIWFLCQFGVMYGWLVVVAVVYVGG